MNNVVKDLLLCLILSFNAASWVLLVGTTMNAGLTDTIALASMIDYYFSCSSDDDCAIFHVAFPIKILFDNQVALGFKQLMIFVCSKVDFFSRSQSYDISVQPIVAETTNQSCGIE